MSSIVEQIETVAERLEELRESVVFVGGATTTLFVTDSAVTDIRPTKDIDVIVEVASFASYARLEEQLRTKGFLRFGTKRTDLSMENSRGDGRCDADNVGNTGIHESVVSTCGCRASRI